MQLPERRSWFLFDTTFRIEYIFALFDWRRGKRSPKKRSERISGELILREMAGTRKQRRGHGAVMMTSSGMMTWWWWRRRTGRQLPGAGCHETPWCQVIVTETAVPAALAMETADGLPILNIPPDMKDQIAAGDAPAQYGLDSGSDQWRQENQIGCIPRLCQGQDRAR